jgi:hypothetical protein
MKGKKRRRRRKEERKKKKEKAKTTVRPQANYSRSLNSKEAKMPTQYEYNLKCSQIQNFRSAFLFTCC